MIERKKRVFISDEILEQIIELRLQGCSQSVIAYRLGLVPNTVYNQLKKAQKNGLKIVPNATQTNDGDSSTELGEV